MKNMLLVMFAAFMSLLLVMGDADARMGGGKTLGKTSPSYSRQATSPSVAPTSPAATRPMAPAAAPASSGMSRWLGPLAGLAAGGLLASMFMGHGFEGLQFLDILIMLGIGVGVFMLIKMFRARSQMADPNERFATAGATNIERFQATGFDPHLVGGGANARPLDAAHLAWFNEENFLQNARTYYLQLQEAWDANRMSEIEEYVTPELYRVLAAQRAELGATFTEVVNLRLDFLGLATEGDTVFAGVRYSGLVREQRGAAPQPFAETYHIQRSLSDPNANWYIAGIQQG